MADWNPSPRCSATHKLVIYMTTFSRRISPFFPEFRHFLVSARGKLGLDNPLAGESPVEPLPDLVVQRRQDVREALAGEVVRGQIENLGIRLVGETVAVL